MNLSIDELKSELDEARQLIQAIRRGEVDTILGDGPSDALLKVENYTLMEERNRLMEELRHANAELQKAERLRDEFLKNISHEMKTPLTDIIGFSEILLADPEFSKNAQWREFSEMIHQAGFRFLRLVDNLLELSRLMSGNYKYRKAPSRISLMIDSAVDALKVQAEKKGIRVRVETDIGAEKILCDSKQVERVLRNILENAIASSKNHAEIKITASLKEEDLTLGVRDYGKGIHPEDMGKVFSQYSQPKETHTGYVDRPGLGLAIAKRIIDDHGGKIWVESDGVEKGALFCFSVPRGGA